MSESRPRRVRQDVIVERLDVDIDGREAVRGLLNIRPPMFRPDGDSYAYQFFLDETSNGTWTLRIEEYGDSGGGIHGEPIKGIHVRALRDLANTFQLAAETAERYQSLCEWSGH